MMLPIANTGSHTANRTPATLGSDRDAEDLRAVTRHIAAETCGAPRVVA
jgi:hypothetical protein